MKIHPPSLFAVGSLVVSGCATTPVSSPPKSVSVPDQGAVVTVDFAASRGAFMHPERFNNVSRPTSFPEPRDADVAFFNEQGLHGSIYRVWVDTQLIHNAETGAYDYAIVEDYLGDLSRLSDNLLVVLDTRVQIRDRKQTPAQIKPVIKTILRELKRRYPQVRYVEAFNEPDHSMAKAITPQALYDYYVPYYEAVNELNEELRPQVRLEVGGPALMMYNEPWLRAFLDRFKADSNPRKRLDFISYHAYGEFPAGTGDAGGPRAYHFFKGDPSEVAGQRARLEAELESRGLSSRIPSFITELGIYPGPSFDNPTDARPDYLINAAGVPSLIYWFMEQPHTVPFNWVLRHKTEERKDQLITRAMDGRPMRVAAGDDKTVPTRTFSPYGNAMLMFSKLKGERVAARSNALEGGKGVYAIATRDRAGAAVMVWNYQHTGTRAHRVTIDMGTLPPALRNKTLRQREYRIDERHSNYWADPATANLQQISDTTIKAGKQHRVAVDLSANALQLVVLEPADAPGRGQ